MGDLRNNIAKEIWSERVAAMQARLKGPPKPPFVPQCDRCGLEGLSNQRPDGSLIVIYHVQTRGYPEAAFRCEDCIAAIGDSPLTAAATSDLEANVEPFTPANAARRLVTEFGGQAWNVAAARAGNAVEANRPEIAGVWLGAMAIIGELPAPSGPL